MTYTLEKYKNNLKISKRFIFSYNTEVAKIDTKHALIIIDRKFSPSTTRHINYVLSQFQQNNIKFDGKPVKPIMSLWKWKIVHTADYFKSSYIDYTSKDTPITPYMRDSVTKLI
tara:strand:+ start:2883 stop:3224 length:342 start_codon:yes stop_codon:yes gene_type:complete